MSKYRYRYIAFDMDGTLVDTLPGVLKVMQQALLETTGKLYALEELHFAMGISNEDAVKALGLSSGEAFLKRQTELLLEHGAEVHLFEDIPKVLAELKRRGYTLGVVTSRERKEYEPLYTVLSHIQGYFDVVVISEMTEKHKPYPEPLLKFMELCNAKPEETLFVGDAYCDMECASAAGVDGGLALWGALDTKVKADFRLNRPTDILARCP